jgi:hypothetical protein
MKFVKCALLNFFVYVIVKMSGEADQVNQNMIVEAVQANPLDGIRDELDAIKDMINDGNRSAEIINFVVSNPGTFNAKFWKGISDHITINKGVQKNWCKDMIYPSREYDDLKNYKNGWIKQRRAKIICDWLITWSNADADNRGSIAEIIDGRGNLLPDAYRTIQTQVVELNNLYNQLADAKRDAVRAERAADDRNGRDDDDERNVRAERHDSRFVAVRAAAEPVRNFQDVITGILNTIKNKTNVLFTSASIYTTAAATAAKKAAEKAAAGVATAATATATATATALTTGGECATNAITAIDELLGKAINTNVATLVDIPEIAMLTNEFIASTTEGLPDTIVLLLEGLATTCGALFVMQHYKKILHVLETLYIKLNDLSTVVGVAAYLYVLGAMTDLVLKLGKEFVNEIKSTVENKYDALKTLSTEIRTYSTTDISDDDAIIQHYTDFLTRFATIMGFGEFGASGGKRKSQKKQKKQKQQQKSQKKQHKKLSKSKRAKKAKQSKKANKKH